MSSRAPDLRLDWCSQVAAQFAVEHWHYSRSLPAGHTVKIGVWEDGRYIGAVIFAMGASATLKKTHRLRQTELCELARVALAAHVTPVSRILRIALQLLRRRCPGLRLVVSFADADRGHYGGVYQAAGWTYLGLTNAGGKQGYRIRGRTVHVRQALSMGYRNSLPWLRRYVDRNTQALYTKGKHKYVWLFDPILQSTLRPKPYPKPPANEAERTLRPSPSGEGGGIPTRSLQT